LFDSNQISSNTAGPGVYISGNEMVFSNIAESAIIGGDMIGGVDNSAVTLSVSGNTIHSNQGNGFELSTNNYVGSAQPAFTLIPIPPFVVVLFNINSSSVAGNAMATVTNTPISNTFSNNDIRFNQGRGVTMSAPGDIDAHIHADGATSVVTGDIIAGVDASPIRNTFSDNTISSNFGSGGVNLGTNQIKVYSLMVAGTASGNVTGSIESSSISNTFSGNDISGNQGHGVNFNIAGLLDASASVDGTAAPTGGNISGSVSNSSINNTFNGNTIENNRGAGAGVYFQTGNEIYGYGTLSSGSAVGDVTGAVSKSPITNTFSGNDINNNDLHGVYLSRNFTESYAKADGTSPSVSGSVLASVSGSLHTNSFRGNTVNYNASDGIFLKNELRVHTDLNTATVAGNVTASMNDLIYNTFTNNTITGNAGDGISINNGLYAERLGTGTVTGTAEASLIGAKISSGFIGDTIIYNDNDGVNVQDMTDATDSEDATVNLYMQGVSLLHNGGYGLYFAYNSGLGTGTYNGDLGGGALFSAGSNSFFGSTNEDVFNNTGVEIKAERNWWNDSDPSDQIGGDPIDFDPPLTSAP